MRYWRVAAVGWTIVIGLTCWTPRTVVSEMGRETGFLGIPHFDKIVHLGVFVLFAFLWMGALRRPRFALVAAAGVALAIATELGQLIPWINREAAIDDAVVDLAGVMLGLILHRSLSFWADRKWNAAPEPIATGSEAA